MKARVSQATQRAPTGDRKVVFKSTLDSPFRVQWPYVPNNIQKTALASLVPILANVGAYHMERRSVTLKRKRARKEQENVAKRHKASDNGESTTVQNGQGERGPAMDADEEPELPQPPPILAHLTIGINEVTKRLEYQAKSRRLRASIHATTSDSIIASPSTSNPDTERASIAYVFVCRADIDPPLLVAHVPELVASCNAPAPSCKSPPVHLITLPKLAEIALAEAVGLRRISIVALDSATPSLATVSSLLTDIQPPSASWLTGPAPQQGAPHIPTHIKQLRTTAPRDMRAAKQARIEGRRAAKERNKLKFQSKTNNRNKETNKETTVKAVRKVKVKAKPSKNRVKVVSESSTAGAQDFLPT